MSQFKTKEFRKLQKDWYKKLASSGFEDIEDTSSQNEFLKSWSSEINEHGQEYYYMAEHFLNQYPFANVIEKKIWEMHCQGHSVRSIAKSVWYSNVRQKTKNRGFEKSTVHNIIERLRKQMLYRFSND